ncbi:DegT/DnrJ/EryC1/StrS family aminotransferase [candidate division WOR-3 bacterium]|nr:DegT/DnrJ/EryC1/StrS family aminotransferase [candidate division WOR-3 bacterium]
MKKIKFLDLNTQYNSIKEDIDRALFSVIRDSAFVGGRYLEEFEKGFSVYTKRKHTIGTANGTAALFLALKSQGIGKGHRVALPAMTFIATAEAVTWAGAEVVLVDVKKEDLLMDVEKLSCVKNVQAVIPVDLFGKIADVESIKKTAEEKGLKVVWDCCQSHGARMNLQAEEKVSGEFGDCACFSFYPGKNLGAYGDAGAVVTDSDQSEAYIRKLGNHGREGKYTHSLEGFNERLDGIQAAVLSVKLKHLDRWVQRRRDIADIYRERLSSLGVWTQSPGEDGLPAYHIFAIQHSKRDELAGYLNENGIQTGVHYPFPLHRLEAYKYLWHRKGDFQVAEEAGERLLSLPIYPELEDDDVNMVCDEIGRFCLKKGF